MSKFRLYVDESGDHNYNTSDAIKKRFLSLSGVIIKQEEYSQNITPAIRLIKQIFSDDIDCPPILHAEEIASKSGIFSILQNSEIECEFNRQYLDLIENRDYIICCVVLDKKNHLSKYGKAASHPYHYCLNIILERYVFFLERQGSVGDVIAEARGKKEDMALKEAYECFYNSGTSFRSRESIQSKLTSNSIKIRNKQANILGLEFADLLSLPMKLDVLHSFQILPNLDENFTKKVISKIQTKYLRSNTNGKIKGYGKKVL
jgi:hypothetical protein